MADSFMRPYIDAGHDAESLFKPGSAYQCARCGHYLIDLAEDLSYGEMRKCLDPQSERSALPETGVVADMLGGQ